MMAPMLQRMGEVLLHYPGGCVIGERPVNIHIWAMKQMGVSFLEEEVFLHAKSDWLEGREITLPIVSVGVTENLILVAVLAKGVTRIKNAAKEPEIIELCSFLQKAGAKISGGGSSEIVIEGVECLLEVEYTIMPDRIVAGTYLFMAMGCGGEVELDGVKAAQLAAVLEVLKRIGASIDTDSKEDRIRLKSDGKVRKLPYIETAVYPGFPTDLQSSLIVALSKADGISVVSERIFENRFRILPQLRQMGACVVQDADSAIILGVQKLQGKSVEAMELRGGVALLGAGLMADGVTRLTGTEFIRRGYEDVVGDLQQLGALVEWKQDEK
jgi:UDP-N-acetylglucosamine 1-carboxyvinyltransferase